MANNAITHAQQVTAQAFTKGTVPAPYYLYLLMRAQAQRMPQAVASGCAGPATAGGTVYVQRCTAQYKGPTATRYAWVGQRVTVQRDVRGTPVTRQFWVTTRKRVTVVP